MKRETTAFDEMLRVARDWLLQRDPEDVAARAGATFAEGKFRVRSLGRELTVSLPDCAIAPEIEDWWQLVLLHYLRLADGAPLSGRQIGFSGLRDGGLARGGDFDRRCEADIRDKLGALEPEELRARCEALGARMLESNADLCAEFSFFPRYPMTLKLWFADAEDDLPASGRLLLDAAADHYLTIEDAVTAGTILMEKLVQGPAGLTAAQR